MRQAGQQTRLTALDANRTPAALPILRERPGDLSDDEAADNAAMKPLAEEQAQPINPLSDGRRREFISAT